MLLNDVIVLLYENLFLCISEEHDKHIRHKLLYGKVISIMFGKTSV